VKLLMVKLTGQLSGSAIHVSSRAGGSAPKLYFGTRGEADKIIRHICILGAVPCDSCMVMTKLTMYECQWNCIQAFHFKSLFDTPCDPFLVSLRLTISLPHNYFDAASMTTSHSKVLSESSSESSEAPTVLSESSRDEPIYLLACKYLLRLVRFALHRTRRRYIFLCWRFLMANAHNMSFVNRESIL
jgi:hypothetical protein